MGTLSEAGADRLATEENKSELLTRFNSVEVIRHSAPRHDLCSFV